MSNNQAFLDKIYQEVKDKDKDIKTREEEIIKLRREIEKKKLKKMILFIKKKLN